MEKILPGLMRPDESFDYQAIQTVFELYALSQEIKEYYLDKILIVLSVIKEKRRQEKESGSPQSLPKVKG